MKAVKPAHRLSLPSWAFISLVVALVVSGCASTHPVDSGRDNSALVASDFCPDVVKLLDEFNEIVADGYLNDDSDSLDAFVFNAKKLSGLVLRAENEGVDLSTAEADWLKNLRVSARAFIFLAESDPEAFSDEELEVYLEKILAWYDLASEKCRVVIANGFLTTHAQKEGGPRVPNGRVSSAWEE